MNEKKTTILRGTLLHPLVVGGCALIHSQGQYIRTSRIVAIESNTADEVRFETLNTNYRVKPNLFPTMTAMPVPMSMAA